jgi:hypothetical protein
MPIKILAVFANPKGTDSLRLGEEVRVIQECMNRGKKRSKLRLKTLHAATIDDLSRALLEESFDIVHLSGHGTGQGLVLEDSEGRISVPPPHALATTFEKYCPPLKCVILNSCYSVRQGVLMALGIPLR